MTIRYRAHLPSGVNAPPARQYRKREPGWKPPHRGSLDELRGRVAAHVPRSDAMVIWNGAIGSALDRLANEPEVTKERAIEILMTLQADVF